MPTIAIGSSSAAAARVASVGCAVAGSPRRSAARAGCSASAAGRRVVEDQRGGQPQAGGGGEPVAQLDGGQRVEAEVPERPRPASMVAGVGVPEHGRDLRRAPGPAAAGPARPPGGPGSRRAQLAAAPASRRVGGAGRAAARGLGQVGEQRRWAAAVKARARSGPSRRRRRSRAVASPSSACAQRGDGRASGSIGGRPRRRMCSRQPRRRRPCRRRPTAPQAIEVAGSPWPRRCSASASRKALAARVGRLAARCPRTPAIEENSTNASRSRSRRQLVQMARGVDLRAPSTAANRSGVSVGDQRRRRGHRRRARRRSAAPRPAVAASSAATRRRSATSQAATVTRAPSAVSSRRSSAAPGRVRAPAAGEQHQVLGAARGQPAGDVRAQRARCRR